MITCRDVDLILALSSLGQLRLRQTGTLLDPETALKRLESHCNLEDIQVDGGDRRTGLLALSAMRVTQ